MDRKAERAMCKVRVYALSSRRRIEGLKEREKKSGSVLRNINVVRRAL